LDEAVAPDGKWRCPPGQVGREGIEVGREGRRRPLVR